ncbi:MAG: hypothetical protein ACYCTG_00755 [Ferrimicrobium sp.]
MAALTGLRFGPNTEAVERFIERIRHLTDEDMSALWEARHEVREVARSLAWEAARDAAWNAAKFETWDMAQDEVYNVMADLIRRSEKLGAIVRGAILPAILALVVKDSITPEQFDALHGPWASAMERASQ